MMYTIGAKLFGEWGYIVKKFQLLEKLSTAQTYVPATAISILRLLVFKHSTG